MREFYERFPCKGVHTCRSLFCKVICAKEMWNMMLDEELLFRQSVGLYKAVLPVTNSCQMNICKLFFHKLLINTFYLIPISFKEICRSSFWLLMLHAIWNLIYSKHMQSLHYSSRIPHFFSWFKTPVNLSPHKITQSSLL